MFGFWAWCSLQPQIWRGSGINYPIPERLWVGRLLNHTNTILCSNNPREWNLCAQTFQNPAFLNLLRLPGMLTACEWSPHDLLGCSQGRGRTALIGFGQRESLSVSRQVQPCQPQLSEQLYTLWRGMPLRCQIRASWEFLQGGFV